MLRKLLGASMIELEVPEDSTIDNIIERVIEIGGPSAKKLILHESKISGNLVILLNKRDIYGLNGRDTILHAGDEVMLLPHVQGG
jgi:molybdopterin converting factor small subunit